MREIEAEQLIDLLGKWWSILFLFPDSQAICDIPLAR
jgi:hypothetical protein